MQLNQDARYRETQTSVNRQQKRFPRNIHSVIHVLLAAGTMEEKQWRSSTIKSDLFLLGLKMNYPKYMQFRPIPVVLHCKA